MLTRSDNQLLKGIAILGIMLHNLLHLLPGAVAENEFDFSVRNIYRLVYEFRHGDSLWAMISSVISHFGHYGVALFLFLSGYGLVAKYERVATTSTNSPNTWNTKQFISQHIQKLWALLIPGFLLSLCFTTDQSESPILLMLTFVANLHQFTDLTYGPWWFFSLMFQFYLLYGFVLHRWRSPYILWGITLASLALLWTVGHDGLSQGDELAFFRKLKQNSLGNLLPFAAGITIARWEIRHKVVILWEGQRKLVQLMLCAATSLFGLALVYLSAFHFTLWLFSPLFAIMAIVPWTKLLQRPTLRMGWEHLGILSPALFVYHPIFRTKLLPDAATATQSHDLYRLWLIILGFLMLSYIVARIDFSLRRWWTNYSKRRQQRT